MAEWVLVCANGADHRDYGVGEVLTAQTRSVRWRGRPDGDVGAVPDNAMRARAHEAELHVLPRDRPDLPDL